MNLQEALIHEYEDIYEKYWLFMENTYESKIKKQYHRSKINNYININNVKKHVYESLGAIPVFIFLTEICSKIKLPGPYYNVEKGILVIELLLNGLSINDMKNYEHGDSFYKVYQAIFIDNIDMLEKWANNILINCFSSPVSRLLYSKLNNPKMFEHCTMFMDGRHNKITIEDIDLKKSDLYSFKIKKNALNTQFILDSAGFMIYISDSLPCKYNNDDNMFINNVKLNEFFKLTDCMCFDGLYNNVLDAIIIKYKNIGLNIDKKNFCYPIKKEKNKDLDYDEINFNKQLGCYRNNIETFFANFSNIFKRYHNSSKIRVTKERTYNIQLKLSIVLYNIKHFVEMNKIEEKNYYKLWLDDNFDFYTHLSSFNTISDLTPVANYKKECINEMNNLQNDFLNLVLNENKNTLKGKKNKMQIDHENVKDDNFEIQYIIQHRELEDHTFEYEVKWRNYRKQYNSWVNQKDFLSTEIIDNYWNTI